MYYVLFTQYYVSLQQSVVHMYVRYYVEQKRRIDAVSMKKKNREILTALHYKQLDNVNRSEKGSKKYTNHGL